MNFRLLYVFVLIEHGTRRLIHTNVTENPTADWARQQLRKAIPETRMPGLRHSIITKSLKENPEILGCVL